MRRFLLLLSTVVAALLVTGQAAHATGGSTTVYYETVADGDVTFIPACIPGPGNPTCDPRGPGSVFISTGALSATQGGTGIGTVTTSCLTTFKYGADYYGFCTDTLYTAQGVVVATGEINESGLERFEPQTLNVHRGTLTVQQVVYPKVFKLTLRRW
ncbi:hypothetical protein ACFO1B_40765 [Dactylosporangium siamense]|uniref:Secreted protein n=1 Tax=Dactylosporangium siamense TaxID=685454 RepID=A0A919PFF2_9ACTN|nr:hypothetical protein [Dactylosporangium siamense]GIG42589.1 hypothetical protein Dsi01nite_006300 [Dactylosporangium siamense]